MIFRTRCYKNAWPLHRTNVFAKIAIRQILKLSISELPKKLMLPFELEMERIRYGSWSLRRVFIYLLCPRWHSKSLSFATRFSMPTTHEQPDFAHCKFLVFCSLQPTKSACSAAAEKCLSGVGQPLSSVSGRKRYNTLDFASKIVCKQGCSRPYWKPRAKGFHPSGHPHIFFSKMVPKL